MSLQLKVTFNRVAATRFFDGENLNSIRVRVLDGVVAFQPTDALEGEGVYPLADRVRGGIEIALKGDIARKFLLDGGLEQNSYLILTEVEDGWTLTRRHVPRSVDDPNPEKALPAARIWKLKLVDDGEI